jgi:S-adenosylmethionine:tRNA ribosyltransferase-isomerase
MHQCQTETELKRHKHDFWYHLPTERIAQTPIAVRSASRLLVVNKNNREYQDRALFEIGDFLNQGDCLVLNDTPGDCLLEFTEKTAAGGGKIRISDAAGPGNEVWETLSKPGKKKAIPGAEFIFGDGELRATVLEGSKTATVWFKRFMTAILWNCSQESAKMPLPHYIHEHPGIIRNR